ncbi:MAG: hypothetical protein IPM80_09795 [Proteobacteria bacterium]|nr:hypothetical protein [Pseudomonadota bacterium]
MATLGVRAYHGPMPGLKLLRPSGAALCVALLVMALAGVAGQVDAATAPIKLVAEVGPGFTITLKKAGKRVVTLKRGSYAVTVRDRASDHNFRLVGPGVNRATQVARVETRSWAVTLKPGTYTYLCDPHANRMKASFQVTR